MHRGCIANTILFLVVVFVPIIGHLIETVFIIEDDHTVPGKILWLLVVWALPFLGPLLYLLFGQRPVKHAPIMFGQAV